MSRSRTQVPAGLALHAELHPDAFGTPCRLSYSIRTGKVARSRPVCRGEATAAYDAAGRLLRVEVRGRVRTDELGIVAKSEPEAVRCFLVGALPPALVSPF
jgi:hypothetical protein